MSKSGIAAVAVCVMMLGVSGCATTAPSRSAVPLSDAQGFVDERMDNTLVSIDRSLKTLLVIDRGGEAPRRPSPISDTVAGGDVHGAASPRPALSVPSTPQGPRAVVAAQNSAKNALASRTRIDWSGDPRELLRSLSGGIGYKFVEVGASSALPKVNIHRQNASITDVLADVARAIDGKADIRVITADRRVELVYR